MPMAWFYYASASKVFSKEGAVFSSEEGAQHGDHVGKEVSDLTRGDPGNGSLGHKEVGSEFRHTRVKRSWKGPFWEDHA